MKFASACAFLLVAVPLATPGYPTSDPVGVYAILDKVVLLPDERQPTQVELHGAFCVARGHGSYYTAPALGQLAFKLGKQPEQDVVQWRELAALAGTGQVIGFSSRYEQGSLRVAPVGEPATPATPWADAMGLQRLEGVDYGPARELPLLPRPVSPLAGSAPRAPEKMTRPARKLTFTIENCAHEPAPSHYLFEVEVDGGDRHASSPVPAGDRQTSWTTTVALVAGEKITWRARAVVEGEERVPVVSTTFVVGTEPERR